MKTIKQKQQELEDKVQRNWDMSEDEIDMLWKLRRNEYNKVIVVKQWNCGLKYNTVVLIEGRTLR